MESETGRDIAELLGRLFQRSLRANLHRGLTEGFGDAVSPATYPVLSGLARTGPCSAAVLAWEVGLDRSGVSRRASQLEAAGLVRREPDPADRRAVLLALTERGTSTVDVMRERLAARIADSMEDWSPGDVQAFVHGLRRFIDDGPFRENVIKER